MGLEKLTFRLFPSPPSSRKLSIGLFCGDLGDCCKDHLPPLSVLEPLPLPVATAGEYVRVGTSTLAARGRSVVVANPCPSFTLVGMYGTGGTCCEDVLSEPKKLLAGEGLLLLKDLSSMLALLPPLLYCAC